MNETPKPPIDITTLAWEPSAPSRDTEPFDPEVDITESDWKEILPLNERTRRDILMGIIPRNFSNLAVHCTVNTLSPQRAPQPVVEPKTLRALKRNLNGSIQDFPFSWNKAPYVAALLKVSLGKTTKELGITEDDWRKMLGERQYSSENELWGPWGIQSLSMAILMPDRTSELSLNDEEWENYLEKSHDANQPHFTVIGIFKLLLPHKAHQFPVSPNGWRRIHQQLQDLRQSGHWYAFCELAIFAAIISSKEARITERGIELVMPDRTEPFQTEVPPMPLVRRF